ncbi:MAG: DUF6785 family protein [Candidatus Latescibacterota bacterium]|nr:DUF6785 family protein [Candidatus Latescibacterota bacterium]
MSAKIEQFPILAEASATASDRSLGKITLRAVLLGLFLVVTLDVVAIYIRYIYHGSLMTYSHVPMAMLICFVLMMAGLSIFTRWTGILIYSTEWHVILAMGLVGATLPCFGHTGYLIGYITAPHYFATPENAWDRWLLPHVPNWLIPANEGNAVAWFFEGMPQGGEIPWGLWVMPIFWWFTMVVAAFVTLACTASILRRQWVDSERLVFPAMQPLMDMAGEPGDRSGWLPVFTQSRLFWIGFAIAFGMIAWNCINYFLPGFPRFPIYRGRWYWIDRQFPPIRGFLGIFTIFFSYFASLDVLLSIWLFDLLFIVEGGWLNQLGYRAISPYYSRGAYSMQTRGAFVVMVFSVFWVARRHFKDVVMKALGRDPTIDDSGEFISYRTGFFGMLGGMFYMYVWVVMIGFDPFYGALFIPSVIFCYVGTAKILADTGIPYTSSPVGPWSLIGMWLGSKGQSPGTMVAYRFSSIVTSHFKALFLPALTHAGKISDGARTNRRQLMTALGLAFVVSFVTCVCLVIYLGYQEGAYNFNSWEITRAAERAFPSTVAAIQSPGNPFFMKYPEEVGFFGGGMALMGLLIFLRHQFTWWPLHPVGLAISGSYLARRTSFTVFVAWLIKLVMLKVGGPAFYRKSRPLFVGLLVGYVVGVAFSAMIDVAWFPERGHSVHKY